MEAVAVLLQEGFCNIWPCGDPKHGIGPAIAGAIAGAIITYLVIVYLLKHRKPNKV
jgi:hypothetical protein